MTHTFTKCSIGSQTDLEFLLQYVQTLQAAIRTDEELKQVMEKEPMILPLEEKEDQQPEEVAPKSAEIGATQTETEPDIEMNIPPPQFTASIELKSDEEDAGDKNDDVGNGVPNGNGEVIDNYHNRTSQVISPSSQS